MKMLLLSLVSLFATSAFAGSYSNYAYQISNNGNCKLMEAGQYVRNVDFGWCSPIEGRSKGSYVKYEWSNKGLCKIMINSQFSGHTSAYYCQAND